MTKLKKIFLLIY